MEKLTIKTKEKGKHTCSEVLIKLSELIKRSLQFGKIINSYSLIRYGQIVIGIWWQIHSAWLMLQDRCENFGENMYHVPQISDSRAATFRS